MNPHLRKNRVPSMYSIVRGRREDTEWAEELPLETGYREPFEPAPGPGQLHRMNGILSPNLAPHKK